MSKFTEASNAQEFRNTATILENFKTWGLARDAAYVEWGVANKGKLFQFSLFLFRVLLGLLDFCIQPATMVWLHRFFLATLLMWDLALSVCQNKWNYCSGRTWVEWWWNATLTALAAGRYSKTFEQIPLPLIRWRAKQLISPWNLEKGFYIGSIIMTNYSTANCGKFWMEN